MMISALDQGNFHCFDKDEQVNEQKITLKEKVVKIMLPIEDSDIVPQFGSTCKITTIGSLDRFFARTYHFSPIPVFKNSKGLYGAERSKVSLRQLVKTVGSVQGEILDVNQLTPILTERLGYKSELVTINDSEEAFRRRVISELEKGVPCISFFYVDNNIGSEFMGFPIVSASQPASQPYEHSCLITGYDSSKDELRITHWGRHFHVPLPLFYQSNQSLVSTRDNEQYVSLKEVSKLIFREEKSFLIRDKYYPADEMNLKRLSYIISQQKSHDSGKAVDPAMIYRLINTVKKITSIVPKEHTGFKGKLICFDPLTPSDRQKMVSSELRLGM